MTMTMTPNPTTSGTVALVDEALRVYAGGSTSEARPDLFAPNFHLDGPARELFPAHPFSDGDLTDVALDLHQISPTANGAMVQLEASGLCHRTVAEGRDVHAAAVLFFQIAEGRITSAQGVVRWDDPSLS